ADRAALLLPAVDPIRKLIVGDHVVELRGRLVVPRAPGLAAVDRNDRALIAGDQDDLWIIGIDPDGVVIITAGRSPDGGEVPPAIGRAIGRGVGDVDD